MAKKTRDAPGKETLEITTCGDLEALEVGRVVEAWCRNQDSEWEGELFQGSELLLIDPQAAVQIFQLLLNGKFLAQAFDVLDYDPSLQ